MTGEAVPDRDAIEREQLAALNRLLAALLPGNTFYARKWRAARFQPGTGLRDLASFFDAAPFTTKQEIADDQQADPPFGTNLTYPLARYTRFSQTSGTTGLPLRWLDTPESWAWMIDNWVRVFRESGVSAEDRIFFAFSFGPFLGFWTAFDAGTRLGALCIPGGGMSSAARVRAILDNGATVLCCTPTYALRLGEIVRGEGAKAATPRVRRILVAGEPGGGIAATRARIESMWPGAEVRDHHGMTEVGPVSYECPARRRVLHVMESAFIPEVLDPGTLRPVPDGGAGELILTNLGRDGSPLLRYRTGDMVRRATSERCDCGRWDLALEGGILGRTDDMVVIRGVNLHPGAVEEVVRGFAEVAEYRVEVHPGDPMPEVCLQVEGVAGAAEQELRGRLESALRVAFNLRMPVNVVPPGTLPRFELKARRWVRLDR